MGMASPLLMSVATSPLVKMLKSILPEVYLLAGRSVGVRQHWVVFLSRRNGNDDIYTVDADGQGETRLTFDPAYDGQPE
jgi:hypothetical protein